MNQVSDGQRGLVRALPGRISPSDCHLDDEVEISIPEEVILSGSLVVYIMPLVAMLAGAGAAARFAGGDVASALGAAGGLVLGLLLVRWHAHRHRNDQRLQPQLMAVVSRTAEPARLA
jgi:sigma-E factor negative regulatory protein RseC